MFAKLWRTHILSNCLKCMRNSGTKITSIRFCETRLQSPVFETRMAVETRNAVKTVAKHTEAKPVFHMERPTIINPGDIDVLFEALEQCKTVDKVFDLIEINANDMNARHIALCFKQLNILNFSEEYVHYLLTSPEFHKLCQLALRNIQFFSPSETIRTMMLLVDLGIDGENFLMKATLQMIRRHINDFRVMEIVILSSLLYKLKRKPSICDALIAALPMLLEIKIDRKEVDFSNVTELSYALRQTAFSDVGSSQVNQLIWNLKDNIHRLGTKEAKIIYDSWLVKRKTGIDRTSVELLLQHCQKLLGIVEPDKNEDYDEEDKD